MRLSVAVRISAALHASLMPLFIETSAEHCCSCTNIEEPNKKLVYKTSFLWTRNTSFGSFSAPKFSPSVLGQWSQLASNSWQLRHFLGSKTLLTKISIYKQWLQRSEGYYLHRLLTHTFEEQHVLPRFSSIKKVKKREKIYFMQPPYPGMVGPLHPCPLILPPQVILTFKTEVWAVYTIRCSVGPVDFICFYRLHAGDGQCWAQPSAAW